MVKDSHPQYGPRVHNTTRGKVAVSKACVTAPSLPAGTVWKTAVYEILNSRLITKVSLVVPSPVHFPLKG
jgi:hypothetical protein